MPDMDKALIALSFVCVVLGVWGYYAFGDLAVVLRVLMVMGGLVVAAGAGQDVLRVRAGLVGRGQPRVVADAQGNVADDGGRVRVRRRDGAVPVLGRHAA